MTSHSSSVILRTIILTVISALQLFCASYSAFAGTNEWTPLGPEQGQIALLTMDPTNSQVLYASGLHGGFKTTNGGAIWTPIAYLPRAIPTALAIDPNNPQVLYQTFVFQCDRVFKSIDGGASFRGLRVGFSPIQTNCPGGSITGFVIDPSDSQTLYAAGSVEGGIFKSTDGGKTSPWPKMSNGLTGAPFFLVVDPRNPQTLYTGTSSSTEARVRLFKTVDGGASWTPIDGGITHPFTTSPYALVIDPTNSQTLYVATYGGIFKSTDGGMKWVKDVGLPPVFVAAFAIDPNNPQILYAAANGGVLKTINGGSTWTQVGTGLPMTPWALAIDLQNSQVIYAGVYGEAGVYKSTDGGERWGAMNAGLSDALIPRIVINPKDSQILYSLTSFAGVFKSTNGGSEFASMNNGLPNPPLRLTIDPTDPQILYATLPLTRGGVRANFPFTGIFKTTNGGAHWTSMNEGLQSSVSDSRLVLPDIFVPVVIDPQNPQTLYVAYRFSGGLYQSTNGGKVWKSKQTNPELKRVVTLDIDPTNPQTLYAGRSFLGIEKSLLGSGGFVKSTNGGSDWSPINEGFPKDDFGRVATAAFLAIDPNDPQVVYASIGVSVAKGGFVKSTNGGANWEQKKNGIPGQFAISSIAIDPRNSQILYVGTNTSFSDDPGGVYKSTDGGENWAPLNNGFPQVRGSGLGVLSLAIDPQNPNTLYAGTAKYGLFVLTQQ